MRQKRWQLLVGTVLLTWGALCGGATLGQRNDEHAVRTYAHLTVSVEEAYEVKLDEAKVGTALPGKPLEISVAPRRYKVIGRGSYGNSSSVQLVDLTAGKAVSVTLHPMRATRPPFPVPPRAATKSRSCLSATVSDLEGAIKSEALDRIERNTRCNPENARDPQVADIVADLFAPDRFASSRTFLNGLWKTRIGEAVDLCGAAKEAMGQQQPPAEQRGVGPEAQRRWLEATVGRGFAASDFEALSWLFGHANPTRIQGCADFNDNMAQELFFLGKDVDEKGVAKLTHSGMQLQYDGYSLFRNVYIEYLEEGNVGWQNAADATAPPEPLNFAAAKKQAEIAIFSTDPAFTGSINYEEMGPLAGPLQRGEEQKRKELQSRMEKYCPTVRGYCSLIKTTPAREAQPEARLAQASFTDPTTHITWTARVSEGPMNWPSAVKYCKNLHLDSKIDWRLPTVKELMSLYDISVTRTSACKAGNGENMVLHLRPDIDPWCGDVWSEDKSARRMDLGGYGITYAWLFDFNKGSAREDPAPWISDVDIYQHYALCVSDSQK